ncbi:hypothetical protein GQ600_19452 [Phytophthora cactorum]|nr:hypothetical protein GQ600_19452 [Phytophthora cactorum]
MPNHPPRQLELVYVVINDGTLSVLRSTEDKRVCDLPRAIQKYIDDKKPLRLFIARKSDRSWQTLTLSDAQRIREEPVAFVKELLVDENEMDPLAKPGYVAVAPEWKPETDGLMWEPSLETGSLHVWGCGRAINKLQKLGRNCIDQCRQVLKNEKPQDTESEQHFTNPAPWRHRQPTQLAFLKQLCSCRTVVIRGTPQPFVVPSDLLEAKMNEALATALSEMLQPGTMPATNLSDTTYNFAMELVRMLGPLFDVLDNVGDVFEDYRGDVESRGLFMNACKYVLVQRAHVPQLHILVLGYADFLHEVVQGAVKSDGISLNPFAIVRLPLKWMSVCAIKGILLKTRISSADPRTLSDRWKLSSAEELEEAATRLFAALSGQPRKIIAFVSGYPTFGSFCKFVDNNGDFNANTVDVDKLYWQLTLRNGAPLRSRVSILLKLSRTPMKMQRLRELLWLSAIYCGREQ